MNATWRCVILSLSSRRIRGVPGKKNIVMLRNSIKWLAAASSLLCAVSCTTEEGPEGPGQDGPGEDGQISCTYRLKDSTIYFDEEYVEYCEVIDTNEVVVKSGAPAEIVPQVGSVLLVPFSDKAPDGFLGRVTSVSENGGDVHARTESVPLEEVFEELHVDGTVSISRLMDSVVDDDGNVTECGILPDEVWGDPHAVLDSLSDQPERPSPVSKASSGSSGTFARIIPFKYDDISGSIVLSSTLSVKIDISGGKLVDYDINLWRNSFLEVGVEASLSGESVKHVLPQRTFRFPVSVAIGPIVLRPALVYSMDFKSSGDVKVGAELGVSVEETRTRWHNGRTETTFGDGNSNYVGAHYLDAEGTLGLEARLAMQFGVFGQKLLAFGIDAVPSVSIGLSGSMDMNDEDMLKPDLSAELSLSGSVGAYMYCRLFSSRYEHLRASVNIPEKSWELDLLDRGSGLKVKKSEGEWTAVGEFGGNQLLTVDEKGFALFYGDSEDPVDLKKCFSGSGPGGTKGAGDAAGEVVFDIPGNPSDYQVRPYNLVRSGSGEYYFYGSPIMKLIRRVTVDKPLDAYHGKYNFDYDSYGRLIKVSTNLGYVWRYTYYDDRIVFRAEHETVTSYLDECGRLIKTVDVFDSGEKFNISEFNISYDSSNNPIIQDYVFSNGNLIGYCGWKVCQYSEEPDNMNLDIFTFFILYYSSGWCEFIPLYSFPYIHNKNLCTGFTNRYDDGSTEHVKISYTYDTDGDVESITPRGRDGKYVVRLYYD